MAAAGREAACAGEKRAFEKVIVRSPICLISKFNKPDSAYRQTIILKNDMCRIAFRKTVRENLGRT